MKDISELHIRKEINVEGNGKVRLTIESFNSLHRKEYTLSPAMWAASEVLQDKLAKPGSMTAWLPFGIENVQHVEDTRHSNSQHVSYLRIIQ